MILGFYTGIREMMVKQGVESIPEYMKAHGLSRFEYLQSLATHDCLISSTEQAQKIRALLEEDGLSSDCYSSYVDLFDQNREDGVGLLCRDADIASALGCKYLHHTIRTPFRPGQTPHSYDEVYNEVFPKLVEIIRYARSVGITVIYEPQGMYFNGIEGFRRLFTSLRTTDGCEHIGVCFDSGNSMFVDCPPLDFLKEFLPYVKNVHLKDYKILTDAEVFPGRYYTRGGAVIEEMPIGQGDAQIAECVRLLTESGYNGAYVFESIPTAMGLDCFDGIDLGIKYLKENC